jgi:hypothetical protein
MSALDHGRDGVQAALTAQLDRAPWWLISLVAHAFLGLGMWLTVYSNFEPPTSNRFESHIPKEEIPPEVDEEIERDVFDEDRDLDVDFVTMETPVDKDADISDVNVTDDNENYESSKGLDTAISDDPFSGKYNQGAIGIGGGAGGKFGGRFGGRKNLRAMGGTRRTEAAVIQGLIWLRRHQNPDGTWSTDRFMANCRKGRCSGPGATADYDTGNTALALLAFLGAGHTHRTGKFKDSVKRALKALKKRQLPDGCYGPRTGDGHWIYNHLIATMAVAEAYGMAGRSPLLREMAQRGVDFTVRCQNPGLGWRYGIRPGDNDSSCTGWAVLALKSARLSGLSVPREAFAGAKNWFDKITDETDYRAGYTTRGDSGARPGDGKNFPPQEAMTSAAVLSRVFLGASRNDPRVLGGGSLIKNCLPKWDVQSGSIDMYYWYYGSLAMMQLGGSFWKSWNTAMKDALLPTQHRKGCLNGSWDPVGPWGTAGGRVYATAINVLTLEVYYRYGRILQRK